jgi:hypothetical protein
VVDFAERIFGLASEALAEQERQVSELRTRASTLLAAGAVVASLLAGSVFHHGHPRGFLEVATTGVGICGGGALLVFAVLLLRPKELGFSVKVGATYRALWEQNALEQPMRDMALADALEERREANTKVVERLVLYLTLALGALVLEAAGLALAAALSS